MASNNSGDILLTSPAFKHEADIPLKYSCEGEEVNPPLRIANVPHGTQTLAIIMEDPDAPNGTFDHWIVFNIPLTSSIAEGSNPGTSGLNGAGKTGYHGPCPPSGSHRYFFHVYALDTELKVDARVDKKTLQAAMQPHVLAEGTLMGRYQKSK